MAEQNSPRANPKDSSSKKDRKPTTPNLASVIGALKRGEYDDHEKLPDLIEAVNNIENIRKDRVMQMVNEVFGANAIIQMPDGQTYTPPRPKVNPFLSAKEPSLGTAVEAVQDDISTKQEPGTQQHLIPIDDSPLVSPRPEPLANLDKVEAEMAKEKQEGQEVRVGGGPEPQTQVAYIPPEQRGASISGLHSSDIAG